MVIPTGFVIATLHLGISTARHTRTYAVLDRDGLHGRGCAQRDGLLILQTLIRRSRSIHRIVDARPRRTADGHLGRIRERGATDNVDASKLTINKLTF